MTLTLTLDGQPIGRLVSGLKIKSSSPGGFESVEFDVVRKLDKALFEQFTDVLVHDSATGEQVGGGRLLDQGRNDDGTWSVSCIGEGFASLTDRTEPYILVDRVLDNWYQSYAPNSRFKAVPGQDESWFGTGEAGLRFTVDGGNWATGRFVRSTYPLLGRSGQKLGGIYLAYRAGLPATTARVQGVASGPSGTYTVFDSPFLTSESGPGYYVAGPDFPADSTEIGLQIIQNTSGGLGGDLVWVLVTQLAVLAQRLDKSRSAVTGTVYGTGKVTLDQAFTDMVARFCPRLSLSDATIDVGSYQYDQLAWFDGISPKAALEDMLALEPLFAWHVWGKGASGWETELVRAPIQVRYEATTADGFNAPTPSTEVYNAVDVRWRDVIGQVQITRVTSYVASLDDAGITRSVTIDLADEMGSADQAAARGAAFLEDHAVPPNAGTLTITQRIYDAFAGRWVRPWNIRPGSLIRVRGIQPTPDNLNTTSPDGTTVFRVVVASYDHDARRAVLELDTYSLDQQQAIAQLYKRGRRR